MVKSYREENIELAKRLKKVYNISEADIYSRLPRMVKDNHITQLEYASSFKKFAHKCLKEETCLEEAQNAATCAQKTGFFQTGVKCNDELALHTKCLDDKFFVLIINIIISYKNDKVYESLQNRYLKERKITYIISAIKDIAKENGYDSKKVMEIL